MLQQHLVELFLQNIPEELAVVFTTSVFLKVKIDKIKIIILGILSGIIIHLIRLLPLSFGFHSIIMFLILTIIFSKVYNKKFLYSFFAVIKTVFLLSIFEAITINTFIYFSESSFNPLNNVDQNVMLVSLLMLPQIILVFLVGIFILYYRQQQGDNNDKKNSR